MGFSIDVSVPMLTVFVQGLISFFSPCVLPLIPLYIGYLSGGTGVTGEDGKVYYKRSKVMLHTLFFVIGVSFTFFLLGLGMSAIGTFFRNNQMVFARIGGIVVVLFGLYQMGFFGSSKVLGKEHRLPFQKNLTVMSPITALLMGFTFSFAWTPCVGPTLTSVLLMTASAKTKGYGFFLIAVYTLGFVLPFLAVGLFTTSLLEFFKKHGQIVKYTVKIGGILMILMGLLMFTGKMNGITGYLSNISGKENIEAPNQSENVKQDEDIDKMEPTDEMKEETTVENSIEESSTSEEIQEIPAIDFSLTDQYGNVHTLADYEGKTIFLNFWGSWCGPCRAEMPDIQKIYESYDREGDDALIVLGVVAPELGNETTVAGITTFLEENGYTYPVLMDTEWELFEAYGITSYPTTFMIDHNGNIFGYVSGQLDEDIMKSIIQQTMDGVRTQ